MSEHDQWLEQQGGVYDQLPACEKCGYELCEHSLCRHCDQCFACEEEEEQFAKKPPVSIPARGDRRKTG